MSEPVERPPPSPGMSDLTKIRAVVLRELHERPAPRRWWIDTEGLVLLQVAVVTVVMGGWSVLFGTRITLGWPSAVLAVAVLAATVAAVRPGQGYASLVAALVLVGAAIAASVGAAARPHVITIFGEFDCVLAEIGISALPAVAALLVLRRFSFSPQNALLGGLAVGCTGVLALDLTCPIGTGTHVLAYHLMPCVALAVAFAAVRARMRSQSFVP